MKKFVLALALIAVASVVLVGTAVAEEAQPGDPGNQSENPHVVECNPSTEPVCDGAHEKLMCRYVPGARFGEWMCVGSDRVTQESCGTFDCKELKCRMVRDPATGAMEPQCVENPGEMPGPV